MSWSENLPLPGSMRHEDGSVEWNLWAPLCENISLVSREFQAKPPLMAQQGGWHHLRLPDIPDGFRYSFQIRDQLFPDPASRWQPDGVHEASAVFTPEHFSWTDAEWPGIPREQLVIYELHVGTFTPAGTLAAIIPRLNALKSLGVTALELMPVAQFPGERNWGYDGVFPYAVQNSYGGPRALQELVNAAHQAGIAILLDVVYNHLGPEGNYLSQFGPYFTDAYRTPWGAALNFDGPDSDPVRRFVLENARYWIRDFHLDGLRLDAVHAIYDLGARPILSELAEEVHQLGIEQQRHVHVIAESDRNDPRLVDSQDRGGCGIDAVWADDFHHSVLTLLTGETTGYFGDYGTTEHLARAYERVFVYDGAYSICRRRQHGAPVNDRDRTRFVVAVQNHDQVGNRALGDRPATRISPAAQRLMCGLLIISPCIPLLFMGQEYGETHPFPFFCSFLDEHLVDAVRQGRRREFASLGFQWGEQIPDPQAESTFQSAKLSWNWSEETFSGQIRNLYRDGLRLRTTDPGLRDRQHTRAISLPSLSPNSVATDSASGILMVVRGEFSSSVALVNPWDTPMRLPEMKLEHRHLKFSTERACYGGPRNNLMETDQLFPFEMQFYGY